MEGDEIQPVEGDEIQPAEGIFLGSVAGRRAVKTASHQCGRLSGRQIALAGVAQLVDYERGDDLELWQLWLEP